VARRGKPKQPRYPKGSPRGGQFIPRAVAKAVREEVRAQKAQRAAAPKRLHPAERLNHEENQRALLELLGEGRVQGADPRQKRRLVSQRVVAHAIEEREAQESAQPFKGQRWQKRAQETLEEGGLPSPTYRKSTRSTRTRVWIFEGLVGESMAHGLLRVLARERPQPRVRVSLKAGHGDRRESMGSRWRSPRGGEAYLVGWRREASGERIMALVRDEGVPIHFYVEARTMKEPPSRKRKPKQPKQKKQKKQTKRRAKKK
jgi:hypothetical protein